MKFRKTVLACLAALPAYASAQSVTLYGVVDTGIEYVNRIGSQKESVFRIPSFTGSVGSRWGLSGEEDLGGGLKSLFVLESGFAPDTGETAQDGRLFGRQALVGLSGSWGQLAFGRQYTMLLWSMADADILGGNTFGTASLDPYLASLRTDNAISYKGKFGGLTVGGTYSFGRDAVNPGNGGCAGENSADRSACREWSALLQYDTTQYGVAAAYDSQRGGPGASGGLTNSGLSDDRLSFGGYVLLPKTKIGVGLIHRNNEGSPTPRSNLWYGGIAYDISPAFTLAGQVLSLKYRNSADKAMLYVLRGTYNLSKRTSVYATAGFIDNGGQLSQSVSSAALGSDPAPGGSQFGTMLGIKHIF